MIEIFSQEDKRKAFTVKRNLWLFWGAVCFVFLAIEAALITVNLVEVLTVRSREHKALFMVLGILAAALFAAFSLFFFSTKFRLTRKFVKMLKDIDTGLKDETSGRFVEYEEGITDKDGVFFYNMVLECSPLKRGDITTRKVLIEKTIERPALTPGDRIHFITHANILVSYEIIAHAPREDKTNGEA